MSIVLLLLYVLLTGAFVLHVKSNNDRMKKICEEAKVAEGAVAESKKYADDAKGSSNIVSKKEKELADEIKAVKKIKKDLDSLWDKQSVNFNVTVVRIAIIFAIEELRFNDSANINERITEVDKTVKKLPRKTGWKTVTNLETELRLLKRELEEYHNRVKSMPQATREQSLRRSSKLETVARSNKILDEAIAHCRTLLKNRTNP